MAQLDKRFQGAPFGTQTPRFDISGVHPGNKMPASFTQVNFCHKSMTDLSRKRGPGLYDVDTGGFNPDAVNLRSSGPGWARESEMQKLSAMPHLLHKDQWEAKRLLIGKLGPGAYNINDFIADGNTIPKSKIGICGNLSVRMKAPFMEKTPGPGTYGEGGVPHAALQQKARQSMSTVGMLDMASSSKRDLPTVGCHLGPGNYNFKSGTDELNEKRVSTKGPYELFSIDRNKPVKTGHYTKFGASTLGPGQHDLRSFTVELNAKRNRERGKFGKTTQHPEKAERIFYSTLSQVPMPEAPNRPGPTSYNPKIDYPKPVNHGDAGFLSKSLRNDKRAMNFFTGNFNSVGAGRYEVHKFHESRDRNGNTSVFKSATGRLEQSKEKAFRERVREKDVKPEDCQHLLKPDAPYTYTLTDHYTFNKAKTVV